MTLEEMKKALDDANLAKQSEVTGLQEQLKSLQSEKEANAQEVEALKSQLKAAEDAVKDLGVLMKSLENAHPASPKEIAEFLKSEDGKKAIEQMKSGVKGEKFELKSATAMTIASNVLPTGTNGVLASLVDAVGNVYLINRTRYNPIFDYITILQTDFDQLVYVEEVAKEGDIAVTAEGDASPIIDVVFQEKKSDIVEQTGIMKASERMLNNISYMASVLTKLVNEKYFVKKSKDIIATIISGAAAFDNDTLLYPTQVSPTAFDAINAAAAQSASSGYAPDAVMMHPTDVYSLRSIKDKNGQPVLGFLADGKTPFLNNGLGIIMNQDATKNSIVVGTFANFTVYDKSLSVEFGFDADDFRRRMRSLRCVGDYHKVLPVNENNFVKGTIADIITALTTP